MRKVVVLFLLLVVCGLGLASTGQAVATPEVTVVLLGPPGDLLTLAVGKTHTFQVGISSSESFQLAAHSDAYYPGRGMIWHSHDQVVRDSYALLTLTMTGKAATADLPAVCAWPEAGQC